MEEVLCPLLPLRDVVVFPHMVVPLFVGRDKSIKALEWAMSHEKEIFLSAQRDAKVDTPAQKDIYLLGTMGTVLQLLRLPDGTVKALIEGVPYRGTLVRMGGEHHMLLILKGIREQVGKTFGDQVKIVLEADTEPRLVAVPPDLMKELKKNRGAKAVFDKLAYTHRKEYVRWIEEAKREETRASRVAKTIEMLLKGKKPA